MSKILLNFTMNKVLTGNVGSLMLHLFLFVALGESKGCMDCVMLPSSAVPLMLHSLF